LTRLKDRAQAAFTIYQVNFDLSAAIELVEKAGCRRSIRLGLAHPSQDQNQFIHPKHYRVVGKRIASFADRLNQAGITAELDCGFVRCMFSQDDLDALKPSGAHLAWVCSPIIDIGLDGRAIPCFPLSGLLSCQGALEKTAQEIRGFFEQSLRYYRVIGIYPECSSCDLRVIENCSSGCLGAVLRRIRTDDVHYLIH
jgi:hypothetical protein